jgi:hypothetical protein
MRGKVSGMPGYHLKVLAAILSILAAIGATSAGQGPASSADTWASKMLAEKYAQTLKLIQPQPGESRWMEIPWQTSLWTARQKAATEGKPMFVWSGSGGAPCAPT